MFPTLLLLPEPHSSVAEEIPAAYTKGRATFDAAYQLALDERFEAAASGFFESAQVLVVPVDNDFAQTLEAGRAAAYYNAHACLSAIGQEPKANQRLEKIAQTDLVMAKTIHDIIAGEYAP